MFSADYRAEAHELGVGRRDGLELGRDVYCVFIYFELPIFDSLSYILVRHVEASDVDLRGVAYLDARGVGYEDVAAERGELSVDFGYRSVRARYVVEGVEAVEIVLSLAYKVYRSVCSDGEVIPLDYRGIGALLYIHGVACN